MIARAIRRVVVLVALSAGSATAQQPANVRMIPPGIARAVTAADTILTAPDGSVSLESFRNDSVTGVYLHGRLGSEPESVGFGIGDNGLRYLWFSITDEEQRQVLAMAYDVDLDLTPDYLLFRVLDWGRCRETLTEYSTPPYADVDFQVTVQPADPEPKCTAEAWTRVPRKSVVVDSRWFDAWRPLFGVAAARGEAWLGQPVSALQPR